MAVTTLTTSAKPDGSGMDVATAYKAARRKGLPADGILLLVSIPRQAMAIVKDGKVAQTYTISTSMYGTGSKDGSNRTPLGLHRIEDRFGDGQPAGRIFRQRVATDGICKPSEWSQADADDLVLSRIMRLRGMTPGLNAGAGIDSYSRCIYIHGTAQEHLLGKPASHGCVRMGNRDVVELFDRIKGKDTWC